LPALDLLRPPPEGQAMTTPPPIRAATVRAVTYRRVSTSRQTGGTSPETQLKRGEALIAKEGWQNVGDFYDPGISGAKASRKELDRLFEMCRAGLVDVVIAGDLFRLSRDLRNSLNFEHELNQLGVQVVDLDNPQAEEHVKQLNYWLGGWQRAQIRRVTHRGILAVAEQGYWPCGPTPFGWRIAPAPDNPRRKIAIDDEAEVATVNKAAELLIDERRSCSETARRLNALGHRPRRSERWNHVTLRKALTRTHFAGEWVLHKAGREITIKGPQILTVERMRDLHRALEPKPHPWPRKGYRVWPLSGRLFGACGPEVSFNGRCRNDYSHGNGRRYECRHNDTKWDGTGKRCHCRMVDADWLDQTVWTEVAKLLRDPEQLVAQAQQYLDLRGTQMQQESSQIRSLDRRLADAKRKRTNLALAAAATGPEAVADAVAKINAEIETLEQMAEQARAWAQANAQRTALVRDLEAFAETAREHLDNPTPEEIREAFAKFDVRVQIIGDGFVRQRHGAPAYRPGLRITGVLPIDEPIQVLSDTSCLQQETRRETMTGPDTRRRPWLISA